MQQVYSSSTSELKTLDSKDLRIQKDGDFSLKLKSREEAFKSVGLSKERMDKLFKAQAASELECF